LDAQRALAEGDGKKTGLHELEELLFIGFRSFDARPDVRILAAAGFEHGDGFTNTLVTNGGQARVLSFFPFPAPANPGCHLQIQRGLQAAGSPVKVRHPVSILAEACRQSSTKP